MARSPITVKDVKAIELMRDAGSVVALIHARIEEAIRPGVTTGALDDIARDTLAELGATSSFLGYHGFPGHICASVNDEIVHGIPGKRLLKDGDIISIDVGAIVRGYHGDSAWTYPVGRVSEEASRLLEDTEGALMQAIDAARSGHRLGAIGHAVEEYAIDRGYGVVREYGGHGIGQQMHEDPHVPNHGQPSQGPRLRTGMTLAIEPMLTTGGEETVVLADQWTVVTADGSLAAHFEHTVAIDASGGQILTQRLASVLQ